MPWAPAGIRTHRGDPAVRKIPRTREGQTISIAPRATAASEAVLDPARERTLLGAAEGPRSSGSRDDLPSVVSVSSGHAEQPVTSGDAAWARSGAVALTGRPDGPPLVPPGTAALRAAGLSALLADFTSRTGRPVRVDGPRLLSERAAYTRYSRRGPVSAGGSCRLLPTADGWAAVSCARPDDPALLSALAFA
jgi:hypothetical protein